MVGEQPMRPFLGILLAGTLTACGDTLEPESTHLPSAQVVPASDYEAIFLGALPLPACCASEATAVNSRGQVVGWSGPGFPIPQRVTHAFLWHDGVMRDLGTLGGESSRAVLINERGQVAGWSATATGESNAFLSEGGTLRDLGNLGGGSSHPTALSSDGAVVGFSTVASGATHAFLWRDGVLLDLGTLGGDYSAAFAINSSGHVVGESRTGSGETHAFLWDGSALRELGTLGGSFSTARAISESGVVTGEATDDAGTVHGFFWQNGVMRALRELPGHTTGMGIAVTNAGAVAGHSEGGLLRERHGVLWIRDAVEDLGFLFAPRPRTTVIAINQRNQVAGASTITASSACTHTVLWEHGVLRDLGVLPGHDCSFATGLNELGDVVGWSSSSFTGSPDTRRGVLWRRGPALAGAP